jgi:hypothetical protein
LAPGIYCGHSIETLQEREGIDVPLHLHHRSQVTLYHAPSKTDKTLDPAKYHLNKIDQEK